MYTNLEILSVITTQKQHRSFWKIKFKLLIRYFGIINLGFLLVSCRKPLDFVEMIMELFAIV